MATVITAVLRRHPQLCYFQGYHDIVQVFLLVLEKTECAVAAVTHLSLVRIRDYMLPSLAPSLAHLRLLPAILDAADPALCRHLSGIQPFFALAATLTLYAHEIEDYGAIARLFDFLLAHEAVVALYLFAAIILSRRAELSEISADDPDLLHFTLSKLPQPLDVGGLVAPTLALYRQHPPDRLPSPAWRQISSHSVLQTTRPRTTTTPAPATLAEGERCFAQQVVELQRQAYRQQIRSVLWQYRRPAGTIGLAVAIGLLAVGLQSSGMSGIVTAAGRPWMAAWRMVRGQEVGNRGGDPAGRLVVDAGNHPFPFPVGW